jgi:photosystem II stability/assembly factor-like uncharacterized protein
MGGLAYGLQNFFGTTNVPLTLTSNVTGTQHSFNNVNELITEAINARVYGGMHLRSSVEDGITIGRDVAAWVARRYFLRLNASPWALQRAVGLPAFPNPDLQFSAVNENVCWGIKGETADFVRTTNGGESWTVSAVQGASGLAGSCITALDANTAWAAMYSISGSTSSGIFKTTDGGSTWARQTGVFPGLGGYPDVIQFFDSNNGVCVGNPRNGYFEIYTTANGGTNWTRVPSVNIPPPLQSEQGIAGGGHPRSVGNNLWFSTYSASLFRTTDRGITWTVARNIIGDGHAFDFAFKDSSNGLACTFDGGNFLSRTSDGGATWTPILPIPSGLSGLSPYWVAYAKGTSGSYVITSNYNIGWPVPAVPGSAYSTDSGLSWSPIDNLPHGSATFVSANVGWSSGPNDALYKWDSNLLVTGVKPTKTLAEGFQLEQNYPNPFNPSTRIKFQVPGSGFVSLKVYDVLGREVRSLVNENLQPGSYETTFDASGLASGVYYYHLQSGSFVETKKLMLLR